jgi:hypothetical protein
MRTGHGSMFIRITIVRDGAMESSAVALTYLHGFEPIPAKDDRITITGMPIVNSRARKGSYRTNVGGVNVIIHDPTAPDGQRERWEPGKWACYEYRSAESEDSPDAQLWHRTHQLVSVLSGPHAEPGVDYAPTAMQRTEAGLPYTYRVEFPDGLEYDVFEDELLVSERYFTRPDYQAAEPAPERRMFALVTTQGTAMPETGLCELHRVTHAQLAHDQADADWDGDEQHDCTGNDLISCIVCGWGDPDYTAEEAS